MPGRPPKPPRETPLDRGKLLQELRDNLETHRASSEKEAIERRLGRRMTEDDRKRIAQPAKPKPKA